MELRTILRRLFGSKPFFGGVTQGVQSDPRRLVYLTSAINVAAREKPDLKVLEVGSWIGSSAMTIAEAFAEFSTGRAELVCVDPWGPYFSEADLENSSLHREMDDIASDDLAFELFRHNTSLVDGRVEIRPMRGLSTEVLKDLPSGNFDLIYIDGSHYYHAVKSDITQAQRLLRDGGLLCGDDLEVQVGDVSEEVARKWMDHDVAGYNEHGDIFHPGVTCAVHEAFNRKVSSYLGFWVQRKIGDQFVDVELEGVEALIPRHLPLNVKMFIQGKTL